MALVAIRVLDDSKTDETLNDLSQMKEVSSVYAVTGRYDIFAEFFFQMIWKRITPLCHLNFPSRVISITANLLL